jgi:hypothetical protein
MNRKAGTSILAKSFTKPESAFKMAVPWCITLLAFFSTSVKPCIIELKLVWQCRTNILSIYCNRSNNCYLLSLECRTFSQLCYFMNRDILLLMTFFDNCLTHGVLSHDIKATFTAKVILSYCCREHHGDCASLLNGEGGSVKRQVVIHIVRSKLQFPSKIFLACHFCNQCSTILLFPEHFSVALVHYQSISGPIFI